MAKLMEPVDLARILGNIVTGKEPQIQLFITDLIRSEVIEPPYERVDVNLETGFVTIRAEQTIVKFISEFLKNLTEGFRRF